MHSFIFFPRNDCETGKVHLPTQRNVRAKMSERQYEENKKEESKQKRGKKQDMDLKRLLLPTPFVYLDTGFLQSSDSTTHSC